MRAWVSGDSAGVVLERGERKYGVRVRGFVILGWVGRRLSSRVVVDDARWVWKDLWIERESWTAKWGGPLLRWQYGRDRHVVLSLVLHGDGPSSTLDGVPAVPELQPVMLRTGVYSGSDSGELPLSRRVGSDAV